MEIFVRMQREAKLLIHTERICQLEETSAMLTGCRLSDSYKSMSAVHPCTQHAHQLLIFPYITPGECRMRISGIDDNINIRRNTIFQQLIKADKDNIHTGSTQGFQHPVIGVNLFAVQTMCQLRKAPQ